MRPCLIVLAALPGLLLHAAPPPQQTGPLQVPRIERPPKLQDFISGEPREAELRIDDFRQFQPGDGTPVSQPTTAYLSYDSANLYVVFDCRDDPTKIRSRLAKREQIMNDDRVTMSIDTFHDHRRAYWFDVNAHGVQADGNVTDGVEDTTSWDSIWQAEARITKQGYLVLMTIPFKSIRYPTVGRQQWGLVVGRFIQRNSELSCWPHLSRSRPGWVQQAGDIEGMEGIAGGRNLQFIPYGLFSSSRYLDRPAWGLPGFRTAHDGRAGVDTKVVLRDSFTLDVALNPDFSQVESDEPQVTVNQRYEVFFPEKRPFFIENAGLFKTPQQLFFSRRIVDPQFGARFTGKVGRWALGALAVDDRAPGKQVSPSDPLNGSRASEGVFRLSREFFRDSSAGVLFTSREFGSSYNRVAAFDTRFKLQRNWTLTSQVMTSQTRTLDGKLYSGPAYFVQLAHEGRHFTSKTAYNDRSPGFRTEAGFIDRVDIRELSQTLEYRWRREKAMILSYGPRLEILANRRRDGRVQDWSASPQFVVELPRQTEFTAGRSEVYELYSGTGFRKSANSLQVKSEWLNWLEIGAEYHRGTGVNYYPAVNRTSFLANAVGASFRFALRPNARTRIDQTYLHSSLATGDRLLQGGAAPASVFDNHIFRTKLNYQFTRELSLRAIVDYNAVLSNPELVRLDRSKHVGADVLLSYILNAGTALHIGYTDLHDNYSWDPTQAPYLRRSAFPDLSTGRQVFVKLSYLFRM
jgi:hypothetical protein